MTQVRDMVDTSALEELRRQLILDQDPMRMHRTRFLEYCEALAESKAEDHTLDEIRDELYALNKRWRITARNLAKLKRKDSSDAQ